MHERATLNARENRRIKFFAQRLVIGQNQTAAGPAQGFMRCCGDRMSIWQRTGMRTAGNKAGNMCHIDQQIGTHTVSNFAETGKIDDARIGRTARNDEFRLMLFCQSLNLVKINAMVIAAHTILHGIKPFAGLVWSRTMGQVSAGGEAHAQDRITGFDERLKHRLIGLRPGIGLHIGIGAIVKFTNTLDGKLFGHINMFATAIITPTGIALGIFIGQHRALHLHHRLGNNIFRGNQLNLVFLARQFAAQNAGNIRIAFGNIAPEKRIFSGHGKFLALRHAASFHAS